MYVRVFPPHQSFDGCGVAMVQAKRQRVEFPTAAEKRPPVVAAKPAPERCPSWCVACTAGSPSGEHRSGAVRVLSDGRLVASVYISQRPGGPALVSPVFATGVCGFSADAADRLAAALTLKAAELAAAQRGGPAGR